MKSKKDINWEIYQKLYYERFPNEKLLEGFDNFINRFKSGNLKKVIDIGCGQSTFILDFLKSNMNVKLYAVDIDNIPLEYLMKRTLAINEEKSKMISFFNCDIKTINFGNDKFDGLIMSNFLHFFTLEEAMDKINDAKLILEKEAIVVVRVNSWKHPSNKLNNPNRFEYFKHYYKKNDIFKLFPRKDYEYLYFEDTTSSLCENEREFYKELVNKICLFHKIINPKQIEKYQNDCLRQNARNSSFTIVLKKIQ